MAFKRLRSFREINRLDFIAAMSGNTVGIKEETKMSVDNVYQVAEINNSNTVGFYAEYNKRYKEATGKDFGLIYTSRLGLFRKAYKNEEKLCKY